MNTLLKVAVLAAATVAAFTAGPAAAGSPALLNTVEYRTDNLDALPQWQKAMSKIAAEQNAYAACAKNQSSCASKAVKAWQAMIADNKGDRQIDQLETANNFINQWKYRTDNRNYGKSDYWASPAEFFSRSGDCEDYAIAKYVTLRQMGFSADQLRLVVVKELKRGIAHAVLAAYVDGEVFILDNLSNKVRPQESVTEYAPYYSVNEQARWAHAATKAPAKVASAAGLFSKS
jgi:predicted transglutaminase-like cysteine proteinase